MTVSALWLVLMVPWDGLQCMIVELPGHLFAYFFTIFLHIILKTLLLDIACLFPFYLQKMFVFL